MHDKAERVSGQIRYVFCISFIPICQHYFVCSTIYLPHFFCTLFLHPLIFMNGECRGGMKNWMRGGGGQEEMEALVCGLSLGIVPRHLDNDFDDEGNHDATLAPKDIVTTAK